MMISSGKTGYGNLCMMRNGVSRPMSNDPQSGKSRVFDLIQTKNTFANEPPQVTQHPSQNAEHMVLIYSF